MSVTLTDKAVLKIKELYANDPSLTGKSLRISVESGGCSSYSYAFKYDDSVADNDQKQEFDGVKLIIDPESGGLLAGSIVDYKEDFGAEGFAIQNPNAKKSCGCGNSFET